MSNSLRKYVAPTITPAAGGRPEVAQRNGVPGYRPERWGGFYPTPLYAPLRVFTNAEGVEEARPEGYENYRMVWEWLQQSPPVPQAVMDRAIALHLRGQFDRQAPYAYVQADFNVWLASWAHPYINPVPEVYYQPLTNGWGPGALTTSCFVGLGAFSFTSDAATVAVAGLARADADVSDPNSVLFGFMLRGVKGASAIESGIEYALSSATPITSTTIFKVEYAAGRVTYYVNGVAKRQTTVAPDAEALFGIACLFSARADVQGIAVAQYAGAALTLPKLAVRRRGANLTLTKPVVTSRATAGARIVTRGLRTAAFTRPGAALVAPLAAALGGQRAPVYLPRLTASGWAVLRTVTLPRLKVLGGAFSSTGLQNTYGDGQPALSALRARGYASRPVQLGALMTLPRVRAIAVGGTGQLGQGACVAPKLTLRSAPYASAALAVPRLNVLGTQDPAGEAFMSLAPFGSHTSAPNAVIFVSITAGGAVNAVLGASVALDASVTEAVNVAAAAAATATLYAAMETVLRGAAFAPLNDEGGETWVVNAESGASSFYEGFNFNSFGTVAGQPYGARTDGLYLLSGDTDAGASIRASVSFGRTDFRTRQLKRMEYAYVGLASSGTMYLKIKVRDGEEYTYAARRSDDYMSVQRVDVGRGIRAAFLAFELYNSDGCDFELNSVEFQAAELSRRI